MRRVLIIEIKKKKDIKEVQDMLSSYDDMYYSRADSGKFLTVINPDQYDVPKIMKRFPSTYDKSVAKAMEENMLLTGAHTPFDFSGDLLVKIPLNGHSGFSPEVESIFDLMNSLNIGEFEMKNIGGKRK